ncbi:MAG: hypothetical protein LBN02_06120 [Oscillospiraceae bacterium]|nr:hypothetical protein [Oscillospiraceae bacterium]
MRLSAVRDDEGRIHDQNNGIETADFLIRVPIRMIQLTERDGKAYPLAFDWEDDAGDTLRVEIERVRAVVSLAEQKSGTVGDRYECEIEGRTEYLYYGLLQPRKWFRLKPVSREEYNAYYRLPGEKRS